MTKATTHPCPSCGSPAVGNFCNNCGSPLSSVPCPSCRADLSPGARFCHLCGTALGGRKPVPGPAVASSSPLGTNAGWIAAGAVTVALVVVLLTRVSQGGAPPARSQQVAGPPPIAAASDISSMTPRQQADRLFDRIMIANENGFPDSVAFFAPMALQAYAMLGPLDLDARYHVGLIAALVGNVETVKAQLDSILNAAPNHLLGHMLSYTYHSLSADQAAIAADYAAFLAAYDSEMATGRTEYAQHRPALEAFREQARAGS